MFLQVACDTGGGGRGGRGGLSTRLLQRLDVSSHTVIQSPKVCQEFQGFPSVGQHRRTVPPDISHGFLKKRIEFSQRCTLTYYGNCFLKKKKYRHNIDY